MTNTNDNDANEFDAMRRKAIEAGGVLCPDGVRRWFTGKVGRNTATGLAAAELSREAFTLPDGRYWLLADGSLVEE